jgi:hypothetical protein
MMEYPCPLYMQKHYLLTQPLNLFYSIS